MLADMHAHYPMHILADLTPATAAKEMTRVNGRRGLGRKARALVLKLASHFLSDEDPFTDYRVTTPLLETGGVGIVFSVLYCPFEELDPLRSYKDPPDAEYFGRLIQDLGDVEVALKQDEDPDRIRAAHDLAEFDRCRQDKVIAVVHCVEGAFTLGASADTIAANVVELKRHGVVYVTVAHLFFRQIATNAPAIPFFSDRCYDRLYPQPKDKVITPLGYAALQGLVDNRIAIDLSHMRDDAIRATFAFLQGQNLQVPVISTHAGWRFEGSHAYMHDEWTIKAIAETGGVVGLILGQRLLNDGVEGHGDEGFERSFDVIRQHIDKIAEATDGLDHIAIGSDFDGFVKPTMPGLQTMADMAALQVRLHEEYGPEAEKITSGNAERVLRRALV